ncbi:LOW QUALITY PROTEIN: major histocompatibility complex class I-related gene protein [Glossophaga mutica]
MAGHSKTKDSRLAFPDRGTHSLRCRLGVSDPGRGIPEFISVGYVDSYRITTYDSVSRVKEPRAPWTAEHLKPDHWERDAQLLLGWPQEFKVELQRLQSRYNHSGFQTYQRMIGCESGSTMGFLQYAKDGQDFIIFSKDMLSWTAVDDVAAITKRVWEANQHESQYQKNWLEEECIAWLKRFLEYEKDALQRTEPPPVRVNHKETCPGITTLFCTPGGFYPPPTPETSMMMENGEEMIQEMDYGDILPSRDGTYQTLSEEPDPQSSDLSSCHAEHCVQMVLQVPQELETKPLVINATSGSLILAIALAGVGLLAWRRRPREGGKEKVKGLWQGFCACCSARHL